MKFLFLMDPLESVHADKDTTLMIMVGAQAKGHEVFYLPKNGISLIEGKLFFHVQRVVPQLTGNSPFIRKETVRLSQDQIQAVFIRPDPPFDQRYLENTWLLDHLPASVAVINHPSGVRSVNEKIWATQFTGIVPPTVITADRADLLDFIETHTDIIAKPTDAFGGQGVFHIKKGDTNAIVTLEVLSQHFTKPIILQRYVPESSTGDKRILLLGGEILGAVWRIHQKNDHRNNLFAGGEARKATITARDKEMVAVLKPHLQKLGLHFVGIDILGDYLIEVNVTSPTCLQEINRLTNVHLEEKIIDFVEQLVRKSS